MPRAQRVASETAIYHVLLRGINQQTIFEDPEDYQQFLEFLGAVKVLSKFELYAFCLMGNHVHLLLKETDEPLANIFRRVNTRYAQWFNWKYQRSGHLFQDRYKSEPVQNEAYFITAIRYIHNNPVKAGLCKKPDAYKWSSLHLLKSRDPLIDWSALETIVPLTDIAPLANEEMGKKPLDISQDRRISSSDKDGRELLERLCGTKSVSGFQKLDKVEQLALLPQLKESGLSIRQIVRLTGLSKSIVERRSKTG
jgi:REP element-mobilizing transposase RayT